MMRWLIVLLVIGLGALAVFSVPGTDETGATGLRLWSGFSPDAQELTALAAAVLLLGLTLPGLFGGYSGRIGRAIRDVFAWSVIGIALMAGYSYRDELGRIAFRIAGELTPPGTAQNVEQRQTGERAVRIRRRGDGHFVARVSVDGQSVSMLVDTGASSVVLKQTDAKLLGVDLKRLRYTVPVQTANGLAYAAQARLTEVQIGTIAVRNVDALVAQPGVLKESLLGMSFLSRLRSYEFAGEFLTFRN